MFIELDGKGAIYGQIVRALRQGIRSGRLVHGMRLAPSRDMARQLGVSRKTVTAAYERLLADGWLTARVGSGTFVSAPATPMAARQHTVAASTRVSRFATRLLDEVVMEDLPGRAYPGVHHMFQYKAPYTDHTLLSAWTKALRRAASYTALRYARCQGIEPLRVQVSDYLSRRRGIVAQPDDIVIVNGSQQAYSLCARILFDPGERVLIEEPGYYPMRVVMQAYGAELLPGIVDAHGMTLDALERAPRLVVVTPAHQFPMGHRLSNDRRQTLLEYAGRHDAWLIEDDYDGEFRYESRPSPTLHSRDRHGRVIHVGSFSKSLFPALRLGYVVVPPSLRDAFVAAKFVEDMGAPVILQAAMASILEDGSFDRHLIKSVRELRIRRDALVAGLRSVAPGLRVTGTQAGMHVVVTHPDWTPGKVELLKKIALERGLAVFSTVPYYLGPATKPGLLLGYASTSVAEIGRGLRMLAGVLKAL